ADALLHDHGAAAFAIAMMPVIAVGRDHNARRADTNFDVLSERRRRHDRGRRNSKSKNLHVPSSLEKLCGRTERAGSACVRRTTAYVIFWSMIACAISRGIFRTGWRAH